MCGIVGFTGQADPGLLRAMTRVITHRGPDDSGHLDHPEVSLGMRRLSIVDLVGGGQPISNETGDIWTVFNGEIYNHLELRAELIEAGHVFKTHHSDTEVIVHLYEEYGEDWITKVNGMFGLAVWDQKNGKVLLYRDRLGKKPLYYALKNGRLIFGSEIKSLLLHPAVSKELDHGALYHYFGLKNTPAPRTAYADIRQLPPGHLLVWQNGRIETRAYWQADFSPLPEDISEDEAAGHLIDLLDDAVRLRMDCDVPYGAYLSGGVDSSLVVSLMSRHQSQPVITFCLGYEDDPTGQFAGKAQDIHFARKMSQRIGTEHYELIISAQTFAELMPEVIAAFDEPFSGTISTYFLSILIKQHVKVAISGDGADELFGSYLTHRLSFPTEHYFHLQRLGQTDWEYLSPEDRRYLEPFDTPEQFAFLKSLVETFGPDWRDGLAVFTEEQRKQLLSPGFLNAIGGNGYPSPRPRTTVTARDFLNQTLEIDQNGLLPNQVLPFVDRLSMAHSIEVRCPFLDYRIVEFVNHLPGHFKIKGNLNKYILKKAVADLLPQEILERPKEGFVQPVYSWMHGSLKDWTQAQLEALPQEIFRMGYIRDLYKKLFAGDTRMNPKVWNLICFSLWHQQYCS